MAKARRPGRPDAKPNRELLLARAREVLAERGVEAEIVEIAARAGVGVGTIYRNFRNRDALILEIAREMVYKTSSELLELVVDVNKDARESVARAIEIGFKRVEEYGLLTIQLVAGTAPEPFAGVLKRENLGQLFRILLQRGVEQGCFRSDLDTEYAVAAWFALVAPEALSVLARRRSVREIANLTTEFYLGGITPLRSATDPPPRK
jgi:AcrR family transcriptional regulator